MQCMTVKDIRAFLLNVTDDAPVVIEHNGSIGNSVNIQFGVSIDAPGAEKRPVVKISSQAQPYAV